MGPGVPPDGLPPPSPSAHFLHQAKAECLFLNGTQRVRYLQRYFYDRQEMSLRQRPREVRGRHGVGGGECGLLEQR
ncbi:putative MHC class II antigen protein [Naja naja]|nr:putative MHC class II antigen protein [Naja naja]